MMQELWVLPVGCDVVWNPLDEALSGPAPLILLAVAVVGAVTAWLIHRWRRKK